MDPLDLFLDWDNVGDEYPAKHQLNYTDIQAFCNALALMATEDIYVDATLGSDITGTGAQGSPYATLSKALSVLPAIIASNVTIHMADGTYTEPIVAKSFLCLGNSKIIISGNTTTPANVSFTGTTTESTPYGSKSVGGSISGRVIVELEGIRINTTADWGLFVQQNACLILDRSIVTGTLTAGGHIWNKSKLELQGNVTISGWTTRGIDLDRGSLALYTVAGQLTLTGSGTNGWGVHIYGHSLFEVQAEDVDFVITNVTFGFQLGLSGLFQHIMSGGSISITNSSKPSGSAAIQGTDLSSWSTSQPLTINNFTYGFELNSISYAEAVGSRSITNVNSVSSASQNSVCYLP